MSIRRFGVFTILSLTMATGYAGFKVKTAVHPSVSEHLDAARNRAERGETTEAVNYAKAMLMGDKLYIGIDYGDTPPSQKRACDDAVAGAFQMWETALDSSVKFQFADPEHPADVRIQFGKNVKLKDQIVSGYINWTRSIQTTPEGVKPLFNADIHLRTTDPRGRELTFEAMRHTCGHEMGHMFGLDDVPTIGMLMGPLDLRKPVKQPTAEEVETVKAIREECQTILTTASRGTHAQRFDGTCLHDGDVAHHHNHQH